MDNLPESMYDYRPEREAEEVPECKICNIEITEEEHNDQSEMCDFCYKYESVSNCVKCYEGISQNIVDNFDSICSDCEEEEKEEE